MIRQILHYGITLYIIFGWMSNNNMCHLIFCFVILYHWYLNDGRCAVSEMDYTSSGGYPNTIVNGILKFLGFNVEINSEKFGNYISEFFLVVPMLLSIYKLSHLPVDPFLI